MSPFYSKIYSNNQYSEIYHQALVLPVLEPYINGITHFLCLVPFFNAFEINVTVENYNGEKL